MATYRYLTTSVLTGQITGDWLPLVPQNMNRTINAVGGFTGSLNLSAGTDAENRAWLTAVEPEKSVLWVFQDQVPVWVGIIWDWPHQSVLDDTLPIAAATMESLFQHRHISETLTFTNADVFDIFRALAAYAIGKTPNGQVSGLVMGSNESGITDTITYNATDLKKVYDAWNDLVSTYGFEYSIRPAVDLNGNLYMSLDLGYPELGLPLATSRLAYNLPGNLLDYRFSRTGSTSTNLVVATASGTSDNWVSQQPHGLDAVTLAAGYPLLEDSTSLTTVAVTSQAQINNYADGVLPSVTGTQLTPLLTLGAGQLPAVKDTVLGSYCNFNATSPLHPANPDGSPGLQLTGRITGWTLYPPTSSQTEYTWIQLGAIEETP